MESTVMSLDPISQFFPNDAVLVLTNADECFFKSKLLKSFM